MNQKPTNLKEKISLTYQSRPLRYLYLVKRCESSHPILDAIFKESYNRWGGRKTLIIPIVDGEIEAAYLNWLKWYDPDIIYTYEDLSALTLQKIIQNTNPGKFIKHINPLTFNPMHNVEGISSISLFPKLKALRNIGYTKVDSIIGNLTKDKKHRRFLEDNFGCISSFHEYMPYKPFVLYDNMNTKNDSNCLKVTTIEDLLESLDKDWTITCLSQLAGMDTQINLPYQRKYESSLQLIIGDSFDDRLNFWNSRLLVRDSNALNNFPALCVESKYFQEASFVKAFCSFLSSIQQECIKIYSFSQSIDYLEDIRNKIILCRKQCFIENVLTSLPKAEDLKEKLIEFDKSNTLKIDEIPFKFKPAEPPHFSFIENKEFSHIKRGYYAVDGSLERQNNHSITNIPHFWRLPSNNSLVPLFTKTPYARINNNGLLSIPFKIDENNFRSRDLHITFPEDEVLFNHHFLQENLFDSNDLRFELSPPTLSLDINEKNGMKDMFKDLVKKFGGLPFAYQIVCDSGWRNVLTCMIKEENPITYYKEIFNTYNPQNTKVNKTHSESLMYSFNAILCKLVSRKILKLEAEFKCPMCNLSSWKLENKINLTLWCKKCKNRINLQYNSKLNFYLDKKTKNYLFDQSLLTELWTLCLLNKKSSSSFYFQPPSNLIKKGKRISGDLDIICMQDGTFIIGEAKTSSEGFKDTKIDFLIMVARELKPDLIILSYLYKSEQDNLTLYCKRIEAEGFVVKIMHP